MKIIVTIVLASSLCFSSILFGAEPTDDEIDAAISQSDDYSKYEAAFAAAARSLIKSRRCTLAEFKDMGGFVKSQSYKNQPIYFTYCGGMTVQNRIMLDVSTGRMFK